MKNSPPSRLQRCLKALAETSDMVSNSLDLLTYAVFRITLTILHSAAKIVALISVIWFLISEFAVQISQQIARFAA